MVLKTYFWFWAGFKLVQDTCLRLYPSLCVRKTVNKRTKNNVCLKTTCVYNSFCYHVEVIAF